MAYAQWIAVTIEAENLDLQIKNAQHSWGKFYANGDKNNEIPPSAVDVKIDKGQTYTVYACGREDASAGTEGSFDLYCGDTKIGTFNWDCPWGSKENSFGFTTTVIDGYVVQELGGNRNSGAIGNVTLKCIQISQKIEQDKEQEEVKPLNAQRVNIMGKTPEKVSLNENNALPLVQETSVQQDRKRRARRKNS